MKRSIKALFVVIFLIFNVTGATLAAEKNNKPEIKTVDNYVAIFDFEVRDKDKDISRPLADKVIHEFSQSDKYEVIDRGNMNKILGEHKFQMSGCVAQECKVEAGQILGVGKIVTGSVGLVGKTYYLTLQLIDVQTGKVELSAEDECKCEVDELLGSTRRLAKKLLGEKIEQPVATTPKPETVIKSKAEEIERAKVEHFAKAKVKQDGLKTTTVAIAYPASTSVKELTDTGENHALIIGINNYEEWSKLKSPVKDAEEMAKILSVKYNFKKSNITLLTDTSKEKPTLGNILANLNRYLDTMTGKDNLLVFFSGHGAEDDQGETYWVPINGKKNVKMTWIKHSDLCKEIFASEKFKVKNLCILTDSVFSNNLISSKQFSLTPYDPGYFEKVFEKAKINSRELISFHDHHWSGGIETGGLGIFTYYITKALSENSLEVIDFENLVFDDNVLFPIRKKTGTNMLRGRLKTPAEKGGQFVIILGKSGV